MEATPPIQPPTSYPVHVDAGRQERYHRFLPLVKWLLPSPDELLEPSPDAPPPAPS